MNMRGWLCAVGLTGALLAGAGCDVVELSAAGVDGGFERTFTVTGPVDLSVRTGSGDIQIRPGTDNSVHIVARVRVGGDWGSASPEQRMSQIRAHPPVEQTGNTIRLGITNDDPLYHNVRISYDITMPAHTRVDAHSGSGDISIALTADEVHARTGSGDINVVGTSGAFEAHTGSGDVRAGRIAGPMSASTGSGDIEAAQTAPGAVDMRTGSGDVRLGLPAEAAFTVDVHTGSGSIRTTHPITMTGRHTRNRLEGAVLGGGPVVLVRTGSGSVTIN